MFTLKIWWRKIRNRCAICNRKKTVPFLPHLTRFCRPCGKISQFAGNYGMNKASLLHALKRNS